MSDGLLRAFRTIGLILILGVSMSACAGLFGNGSDVLVDQMITGDTNTLRFGAGISASQIRLGLGSLKLDLGNGDEIHIANFDKNDVFNSSTIDSFEFDVLFGRKKRKAENDARYEAERRVA